MSQSLKYTVVNSSLGNIQAEITIDGQTATASLVRTILEAEPLATGGKTLSLVLPVEALSDFPEGAAITVTVSADIIAAADATTPASANAPTATA